MLNKSKGNMFGFITDTWNPVKGVCSHFCKYCFMNRWGAQKPIRLDEKDLKTNLGEDNFIFVGSSTDLFAKDVPEEWINKVLNKCYQSKNNKYLLQTKNPARYNHFISQLIGLQLECDLRLSTTIESNRHHKEFMGNSPTPKARYLAMSNLKFIKMVTMEPIMKFDHDIIIEWIKNINPFQVAIGADSQQSGLPEPGKEEILKLINSLEKFTKVIQKDNLKRLLK
jgi:DNA repair photolyase